MRDLKQEDSGDLDFTGGDVNWANSKDQHIQDIVLTRKGGLKHAPDFGVGIEDFFMSENDRALYQSIHENCTMDGMDVDEVGIHNGKLRIDANYKN